MYILELHAGGWSLWCHDDGERNDGRNDEGYRGEEAEDILQPHQRGVHVGRVRGARALLCASVCGCLCGSLRRRGELLVLELSI